MMEEIVVGRPVGILGTVSAAALGLLPKLTCPVCWPAYSAALGALGIGFVDYTPYLLPLTAAFVAVSILALAWTARVRGSVQPLAVGALAGAALMIGRFSLESDPATYAAIALFMLAPFLPFRRRSEAVCANCVPASREEIRT